MENPDPIDDEVIADSEGEMGLEEEEPGIQGVLSANSKSTASQVSAFTLMGQFHDKTASSISAFTAGPSAVWKQNSPSDVDNFIGIASIADRAKTRQRNPNSSIQSLSTKLSNDGLLKKQRSDANISSDIIELTSDEDDDELSLRPSKPKPKPKPKTRPKPKFNGKDELNDKTLDVSGTTKMSGDKSPDAIPQPRPRPRPRPLMKRSKPAHEITILPPPLSPHIPGLLPSSSASVSHGPDLPIATSPVQPHLHTSYLPPSDPPLPTPTTTHDEADLPQIETLPNGPLSSPSSLFSDFAGTTKKRKRTILDPDIDELASDSDLGFGKGGIGAGRPDYNDGVTAQVPAHMLPPPPTFFAGSSPYPIDGSRRIPPPEPAREVVDLTMLPPTIEPIGEAATKKAAQAKKSRQKKDDAIRLDEDKLDDDFDPTTKKGKPKPKPKPKKTKTRQGEGQGQVEVLITSKLRTQRTKGKGKEKAPAGNKDTFKNREFIDDSGDEENLSTKDPATGGTSPSTSMKVKGAHISADTSVIAPAGTTSTPLSKTLLEENTATSPGTSSNLGQSISSLSGNGMNRKRKSIIESDLEDEDKKEKDHQVVRTSAKKRKGKNGNNVDEEARSTIHVNSSAVAKKGKKGKNVVWSDDDEPAGLSNRIDNDADEGTSTKEEKAKGNKSKSKSKKTVENTSIDDNDAYTEDHEDIQEQQIAQEAKENVISLSKPTAKISKSDDRPKVESPGLFPSLHSRYEIAPRRSSIPMSELIRRANSIPGSPFGTPHPRTSSSSTTKSIKSGVGAITYSPYLKSSRSVLSRIAPLHPNRRTPPPPPPPPPPKKKTKKELEMEEKWEEEMIDSLGGISEWTCLTDDEKKELRRAKWAKEMGDWDD